MYIFRKIFLSCCQYNMVCPKSLPSHVAMLQYEASDKYVYISSLKGDAAQIEPRPPLVIMAFTQLFSN